MRAETHTIQVTFVFAALLGLMTLLMACSGSSGDASGPPCTVVGATEPCLCAGGIVGQRYCRENMMLGACLGCSGDDSEEPEDDRCFSCLEDAPYVSLCSGELFTEESGRQSCVDGESVTECRPLASCCEEAGRTAGPDATCGDCLSRFTGDTCDQCASDRFTGVDCDECSDGRFTGVNCDECRDDRYTGVTCEECADARFTGVNCDACTERFQGADCEQCSELFTGENCEQCVDERFMGSTCEQCSERFSGEGCSQCSERFQGENCVQCSVRFTGANCDQCADGFSGENCEDVVVRPVEFIRIEGGTFQMGGPGSTPIHEVTLRTFEISKTEVTIGQYRTCVLSGRCTPMSGINRTDPPGFRENYPITFVTWETAKSFAESVGARLLTEAEWEYAARSGGQGLDYPWGNAAPDCERLNFNDCVGAATPVCSYPADQTAQGVCDMAGNVREWIEDDWHGGYFGAPDDGSAWINTPRHSYRVLRGGAYGEIPEISHNAFRTGLPPLANYREIGFRLARPVPEN